MQVIIINYVHLPLETTEEAIVAQMLVDMQMWSKYFPDDFIILGGYF